MNTEKFANVRNESMTGGRVYSAVGGDQIVYEQAPEDYFGSGLEALHNEVYPSAVACFVQYLSAGWQADEPPQRVAQAHFYAALALLGASPPRYKLPEDIGRVNRHLDHARRRGADFPVFHQASVLWAIVKEDYYEADGMMPPPPRVEDLRESVEQLRDEDIAVFVEHMSPVDSPTWSRLAGWAEELGLRMEVPQGVLRRTVNADRPAEVRKYFNDTPERKTLTWAVIALFACIATIAFGAVQGGAMGVGLLVVAGYLFFVSVIYYGDYREFQRRFAESEPKPAESQLDSWLREDLAELTRRAAGRLRLNVNLATQGGDLLVPVQTVVGIAADTEEHTGRVRRVRPKQGADRMLRADLYDVYILFMANDMVSTYRCELDFATGGLRYDETREHHYRDIVGVRSMSVPLSEQLNDTVEIGQDYRADLSLAQFFVLSITSGEQFLINTGISNRGQRDMVEVAWRNRNALNVLQKMIRAHHGR